MSMVIGIVGAMEEEIAHFLAAMEKYETLRISKNIFYKGELSGKEVVVALSGIGKVNAAITTTLLLDNFKVSHVFNTGSAGGVSRKLKVGDVVLASDCLYHDVDVTAFGYTLGQLPKQSLKFPSDPILLNLAKKSLENSAKNYGIGVVASGDSFIDKQQQMEFIKTNFPEVVAVEMEAAAIAQVCCQFETPFLVVRAISDMAGKESPISFKEFLDQAAKNSTEMLENILSSMN